MHHMGYDSVFAKPVFFAASRRRGRIFAFLIGGTVALVGGLTLFSLLSLLRERAAIPVDLVGQHSVVPNVQSAEGDDDDDSLAAATPLALLIEGGPNSDSTPEILDVLAREKVRATFVPSGHQALQETQLVKRIFSEGHEIGHQRQPKTIAADNLAEHLESRSTLRVVEAVTGHSTLLQVDPPAAPSLVTQPQPVISTMTPSGGVIVASSDPSSDLGRSGIAIPPMAQPAKTREGFVLVLTDKAGDQLASALPVIINDLRARGFSFTTFSGLLGKRREDVMPNLSSALDLALAKGNSLMLSLLSIGARGDKLERALEWVFAIGAFLAMIRTVCMVTFAFIQHLRNERQRAAVSTSLSPLGRVSVLIPAYNEALAIVNVIDHVLKSSHRDLEVIMIDDGSSDSTYAAAEAVFGTHPQVKLLRKPNGGKASALNAGLRLATGDFIVCIDGDTLMTPTTIGELLAKFANPRVGAVAGCVKIANPNNLLTRWQEVEYAIGQNLDRQALELINGMNTVPGAAGAFRLNVIKEVGGYESDTLAEDTDITMRILRAGYLVGYAPKAFAITEAPETSKQLLRQRFRWSYGAMQTLWKHRSAFGSRTAKGLGWFTLPQVLIFQLMMPILIPVADFMLIAHLWSGSHWSILGAGLLFLAVDLFAAGLALILAGERKRLPYMSLMLVTQRFGYRYFVFIPLIKALVAAIHGRAVGWGHLQRLGRVAQAQTAS